MRAYRNLTPDKYPNENLFAYWQRKHDELHGPHCGCAWNALTGRGSRPPGISLDSVPRGKRVAIYRADRESQTAGDPR